MRSAHAGDVFTISLHQENNYPAVKPPSSIDVDLPDGIGDEEYLGWLDNALSSGLRQFAPELLCYIAGADPYREDQLGGLNLTIEGLKKRDELVFRVARARRIPVMVTFCRWLRRKAEIRYHSLQHGDRREKGVAHHVEISTALAPGLTLFYRHKKVCVSCPTHTHLDGNLCSIGQHLPAIAPASRWCEGWQKAQ